MMFKKPSLDFEVLSFTSQQKGFRLALFFIVCLGKITVDAYAATASVWSTHHADVDDAMFARSGLT